MARGIVSRSTSVRTHPPDFTFYKVSQYFRVFYEFPNSDRHASINAYLRTICDITKLLILYAKIAK